ncbi:MAG TPA: helix-hairpin-helix domain-containing protein [Phycisphaerae bacterium]|nr:helix-hairpin-helix domain-containing protein [Phycisphaerae bacterium]HNU46467.1 helix-hairpin-helix domain-containing protein [Phycisphaerae bacterium]
MHTQCVLIGLLLLATLPSVPTAWHSDVPPPLLVPARSTIDPNVAPWWELAALPGLGPGRAHAIVDYRTAQVSLVFSAPPPPAFTCPQDLTKVAGIGEVTANRVVRYLHFPSDGAPATPADPPAE